MTVHSVAYSFASDNEESTDVISFIGFEWTQVGAFPSDHYGHKNVIFKDLEDEKVAKRPIAASGVAVNALWPRTAIATAAVKNILGGDETVKVSRTPEIMADAAYVILTKDSKEFTGNFCIDDNLLADNGVKDFSKYAEVPFAQLAPDFFVPDDIPPPQAAIDS